MVLHIFLKTLLTSKEAKTDSLPIVQPSMTAKTCMLELTGSCIKKSSQKFVWNEPIFRMECNQKGLKWKELSFIVQK
ncbi:MAG: hypothetical protein MUC49_05600 [Raineya sp.]|nr:hypothetical protein [Raineya sp.]